MCRCCHAHHQDVREWGILGVECCLSCGSLLVPGVRATQVWDEIRPLLLYLGSHQSSLVYEIASYRPASPPTYEAVSYTRADSDGVEPDSKG